MSRTTEVSPPGRATRPVQATTESITPTLKAAARRGVFWIVLAAFAAVVILIVLLAAGGAAVTGKPLAAGSPAPSGAQAVVAVLRQHGVTVTAVDTIAEAEDAAGDGEDTTVLLYDPHAYLTGDRLRRAGAMASKTVLVDPGFTQLSALAPGVKAAGEVDSSKKTIAARCSLAAAKKAGRISATGVSYRRTGPAEATGCFPGHDDTYSLVQQRTAAGTMTVLGSTDVLRNDGILSSGNAALALNLLGSTHTLVWYLPTLADATASGPPSLGELTPGWVTPVMVLLIAVALSAAIWRGRRFGPLVIENLPVTVKAAETMEGRARLYQRSSARLRAIDMLRMGAVARLANRTRLPRTATVTEVADAVAALTGADRGFVRGILVDEIPRTDRDLMRLADQLADLERASATSVR